MSNLYVHLFMSKFFPIKSWIWMIIILNTSPTQCQIKILQLKIMLTETPLLLLKMFCLVTNMSIDSDEVEFGLYWSYYRWYICSDGRELLKLARVFCSRTNRKAQPVSLNTEADFQYLCCWAKCMLPSTNQNIIHSKYWHQWSFYKNKYALQSGAFALFGAMTATAVV